MNIVSICGFILIVAGASVVLKKKMPEYALIINVTGGIIVLAIVLAGFMPVFTQIKNLLTGAKISGEHSAILFKCLGICLLTQFCSDTCKDAGELSLSSKVEFAGKSVVILAALPLFEKIIDIALTLAGK